MLKVNKTILIILAAIVLFLGLSFWFLFYSKYRIVQKELSDYKSNPKLAAIKEKNDIIGQVSRIVEVPESEEPTLATISNAYRLQTQPFFANAQNGDKLIFYSQAKRAILYRPSTNKVIEIATVNISDMENVNESTESVKGFSSNKYRIDPANSDQVVPVKIVVLNGTGNIAGLASRTVKYLNDNIDQYRFDFIRMSDANDTYEKSIVSIVNKDVTFIAEDIAKKLNMKINVIPEAEQIYQSGADIVIIVGFDYVNSLDLM